MSQPQTGGPPGKYGYDAAGNLLTDQTPIQRLLAFILGALQALVAAGGGGGGGGGGGAITAPLGAQTPAASVATVISGATANGNTTSTTTNRSIEGPISITAGALSIEMLLSGDFVGTINGGTFDNTGTIVVGVFRLDAPPWKPLTAFVYTITAGTAIRTIQT